MPFSIRSKSGTLWRNISWEKISSVILIFGSIVLRHFLISLLVRSVSCTVPGGQEPRLRLPTRCAPSGYLLHNWFVPDSSWVESAAGITRIVTRSQFDSMLGSCGQVENKSSIPFSARNEYVFRATGWAFFCGSNPAAIIQVRFIGITEYSSNTRYTSGLVNPVGVKKTIIHLPICSVSHVSSQVSQLIPLSYE